MTDLLKEIETSYPVADITVNGEQIWPYLRIRYAFYGESKSFVEKGERPSYDLYPFVGRWQSLKTALRGFPHWLGKYDYVTLAPANDRRLIERKEYSRFLDPLVDILGQDKTLFIEQPTPIHKGNEHTKHLVSEALLLGMWYVMMKMAPVTYAIQNAHILKAIQKRYDLQIDDQRRVQEMESLRQLFRLLFVRIKSKVLFISDYYGFGQAAVKAAHDLNIKVVETQHGTISASHPAYMVNTDLDKSYFADYLLMFGRKELPLFADGRFIDPSHVIPVGSFYLDYISKTFKPDKGLLSWAKNYDATVAVGLQLGFEKAMLGFVNQAAKRDRKIGYVLMPRIYDHYFDNSQLEQNVILYQEQDMFRVLPQFDFHATVSSTTAIEAPSLGVRDIIADIDGDGRKHLWSQVPESEIARYVSNSQEMVDAIRTYPDITRERVCQLNEDNIVPGYKENITRFLKEVL